MVTIAGWHRDHARKMLRQAAAGELPGPHTPRERMLRYGQEVTDALVRCWVLLDGIASKCLAPAISRAGRPRPARHDRGHQGPLLLTMSPTTMDRHLKPYLQGLLVPARTIHTKPGSLLKSSIPMKTWAAWNDTRPGLIEIDLLGNDDGDNNSEFHYSLNATDIATLEGRRRARGGARRHRRNCGVVPERRLS